MIRKRYSALLSFHFDRIISVLSQAKTKRTKKWRDDSVLNSHLFFSVISGIIFHAYCVCSRAKIEFRRIEMVSVRLRRYTQYPMFTVHSVRQYFGLCSHWHTMDQQINEMSRNSSRSLYLCVQFSFFPFCLVVLKCTSSYTHWASIFSGAAHSFFTRS